eukprot:356816-Pyramimonas_sp.AAC.1
MDEIGRIGVDCHVHGVSLLRSGPPRVVKSVGSLIHGMVVGHDCPDWRSVGDLGFARVSSRQVQ